MESVKRNAVVATTMTTDYDKCYLNVIYTVRHNYETLGLYCIDLKQIDTN